MRFVLLAPVLLPGLLLTQQGTFEGRLIPLPRMGQSEILAQPAADFHSKLVRAEPAVDSTVRESPSRVRLWFTENCEVSLSSIKLLDAAGVEVALGKTTATDDPRSLAAAVNAKLAPGNYTVTYKTAGKDGHAVRGEYAFQIAK